jgi:hypothetical protein
MRNSFRSDDMLDASKAVLARVGYLRTQKLSDEDGDRVTIIEGLGAISVVLTAVGRDAGQCMVPSIQHAEMAAARAGAAFDIVEAINTVADAQLQPLLNAAPKFSVPKRSSGGGGGGAASIGFGSWVDPLDEAVTESAPKVVAALPLVEFALNAGSFFPADKPAGKFFAHLLANKPADADAVRDAVADAFRASEK